MSQPTPDPGTDLAPPQEEGVVGLSADFVRTVADAIDDGAAGAVRAVADTLHAADLADLLQLLSGEQRRRMIAMLGAELDAEVLTLLEESVRDHVVEQLDTSEVAAAVADLDTDDAVTLLEDLDAAEQRAVLKALPAADRMALEEGLSYPEDSAGRLMQRDLIAIPGFWTVGRTIDFTRESENLPDAFYEIFVVDAAHKPIGTLPLSRVMRSKRPVETGAIMDSEIHVIPAAMDQEEVAFLFRQYALVSAPVVDDGGRLIGVITVDDVVGVIEDEAEEDIMRMGGIIVEDDLYRATARTTRNRFSWLLVNLGTAVLASLVISIFDATIEQIVALAILMPVVASMGGQAGTQTLTVAVRALATRELTPANALRVVGKEALVGAINGVIFAILCGTLGALWFDNVPLGLVLAMAMIANMLIAGLAGTLIPLGLVRIKVDPAVAAGVLLTTITDVIGFFSFLGLAALVLL